MGNTPQCQYARFVPGTQEDGFSQHLVSYTNKDPKTLAGPIAEDKPTIVHAFKKTVERLPDGNFLGHRDDKKVGRPYKWMTWAEADEYVSDLARGFQALEMMPDIQGEGKTWNFMGIFSKNRPEWVLTDLACVSLRGTTIAFYDTLGPLAIEYVMDQTELTTITCAGSLLQKIILIKSQGKANHVKNLISMDMFDKSVQKDGEDVGIKVWTINEVVEEGRKHKSVDLTEDMPRGEDISMFCYTSGTTGDPKAAKLSHRNLMSCSNSILQVGGVTFSEEDTYISYLPLAHSFEKVLFTTAVTCGIAMGFYSGDPLKLIDDLKLLRPTYFPSVPRLFNRIYDKITQGVKEKSAFQRAMFNRAINGKLSNLKDSASYTHSLWDSLVFNKMRALLGGRVQSMVTGSAPISADVLSFLKCCFACPIHEGYGQTESCAASSVTSAYDAEAGHVGGPLACVRMRLRDIPEMEYYSTDENPRGEICFQGNSIFHGYYKNPERTKEALTDDGWLFSGDVGMIMPNGSVRIIDRAKNIFKLSQGEYIAPEKLENVYIQSPLIQQVFVDGDSTKSWLIAVCVIERDTVVKWLNSQDIVADPQNLAEFIEGGTLHQAILASFLELAKVNKFSGLEKIKKVFLSDEPFTVENDLLTPTMKIKRAVARKHFAKEIKEMYDSAEAEQNK